MARTSEYAIGESELIRLLTKYTKRKVVSGYLITPRLARAILESDRNRDNRNESSGHVKRLTEVMRTGNWRDNASTIRFDRNGHLQDGQHRLRAIIESGVAQYFDIIVNCDPGDFEVIDSGDKRTAAQVIDMDAKREGRDVVKDGSTINRYAVVVTAMAAAAQGSKRFTIPTRSRDAQISLGRRARDDFYELRETLDLDFKPRHCLPEATTLAAFYCMGAGSEAAEFFHQLRECDENDGTFVQPVVRWLHSEIVRAPKMQANPKAGYLLWAINLAWKRYTTGVFAAPKKNCKYGYYDGLDSPPYGGEAS